ncbi:MAG: mechanosensitive ion channel [Synechococcales cyanobacterium K44_A2020_017]|nr:mechanosensitive ion channel [Synechococcales cyanobacterium K32_A2020_035]MBF2094690.1 mechanosensitive ion channel [Synechococcales cyanobacterium K44_A2020_017]
MNGFLETLGSQLGGFLPSLMGAIAILVVGWIIATVIAAATRGILSRTDIDNRIASWVIGDRANDTKLPTEKWISTAIYWIVMAFVIVAFLQALKLDVVSQPLNNFLDQIFSYLPKIGGAAILLGVAWLLATIVRLFVLRGLQRFHLDDQLAEQTGTEVSESPIVLNETLANALYWFVFLFFLPLVLDVLDLQGPLAPVQNLLDQILSALPKILTAVIIGAVGWLIARIVRGIVTNLLSATGIDRLGTRMGLTEAAGTLSLSSLVGTVTYVLVLIPTAVAALRALEISAISDPAVAMLDQILAAMPKIFTAAIIMVVFYVIGRFVADLVSSILAGVGFNNVLSWLGLPSSLSTPPSAVPSEAPAGETPTTLQEEPIPYRTPSEIVGLLVLIGILLIGAVAATEVLQFQQLTVLVQGILTVSGQVLVGVAVFGVGLYLSNIAFSLIVSSGGRQSRIVGQTARISIIVLVSAMALQQMGIATNIVNLAFGLLLGAIAVAIAIAFGLGGRDIAAEQMRQWLSSFRDNG